MSRPGPVETRIRQKLAAHFKADQIEVVNESHRHNVPENSETHFKVLVVSEDFNNLTLVMVVVVVVVVEEIRMDYCWFSETQIGEQFVARRAAKWCTRFEHSSQNPGTMEKWVLRSRT